MKSVEGRNTLGSSLRNKYTCTKTCLVTAATCFLSMRWETETALPDERLAVPPVIKLNWLGLHALWRGCPGGRDTLRPPSSRLRPTAVPACSVHCQSRPALGDPMHCCVASRSCTVSWRLLSAPVPLHGSPVLHHLLEAAQPSCTDCGSLFLLSPFRDTWDLVLEQCEAGLRFIPPLLSTGIPTPLNGLSFPQWFETPKFPHTAGVVSVLWVLVHLSLYKYHVA